jgi:peroxiredoxin
MRNFILSAVCLLPLAVSAQSGYSIKGKVGTLNSPAKIYLEYQSSGKKMTDSAAMKNGEFVFKGKVVSPVRALLIVDHTPLQKDSASSSKETEDDFLSFFLENANMTVIASDSIKKAIVKGSGVNDDNAELMELIKPVMEKMNIIKAKYDSKTTEERKDEMYMKQLNAEEESIDEEYNVIYRRFIQSHTNSYVALDLFKNVILGYNIDLKTAEPEFNKFSSELKTSPLGKSVLTRIESARKTTVGAKAMDFTLNDVNGNPVKLSDFRGKYVLLDFWASWCGPCRRENPNVVKAYKKYKDKNFTILGVSLDYPGKKSDWLAAIKADGLTWTQVSDLKGFSESPVARLYDIQGIPSNLLLDPAGRIVANNITGDKLDQKLASLLN